MNSEDNIVGEIDKMASDYSYAWTIDNVCFCCSNEPMISPEFRTGLNNENIWVLEICVSSSSIHIRIQLKDTTENTTVKVTCALSILTIDKLKTIEKQFQKNFNKEQSSDFIAIIDQKTIQQSPCKYIPNKKLTILCEIKDVDRRKVYKHRHEKLIDDLQKLFEDPKHTDATIVVGKKTFHVHKAVLVSRSLWFKAAFEGGMEEEQKNEVSVPNYEYEVVQEVLRYIYTGQVKGVEKFVDKLLDAAIYYQLDELKTICTEIFIENLSLENVLQALHLADTYRINHFKKKVLNFISLHKDDLVDVEIIWTVVHAKNV